MAKFLLQLKKNRAERHCFQSMNLHFSQKRHHTHVFQVAIKATNVQVTAACVDERRLRPLPEVIGVEVNTAYIPGMMANLLVVS